MGAGQSGVSIGGSSMGYQVLRAYPNSPGNAAGLQPYFDFIVAAGNTRFHRENGSLQEILKASIDQVLKLFVYNIRSKKIREVEIVPSTSWGGNGLLGVSIKHASFDGVDERVWHVLNVEPNSPAFHAGLKSDEDYVIGADSVLQQDCDDIYSLIQAHEGKALKIFVYNVNTDNCRDIVCHPNSKWGGSGSLGCEFGHGYLHRIPYKRDFDEGSEDVQASLLANQEQSAISKTIAPQIPIQSKNAPSMAFANKNVQQMPDSQQKSSYQNSQPSKHTPLPQQLSPSLVNIKSQQHQVINQNQQMQSIPLEAPSQVYKPSRDAGDLKPPMLLNHILNISQPPQNYLQEQPKQTNVSPGLPHYNSACDLPNWGYERNLLQPQNQQQLYQVRGQMDHGPPLPPPTQAAMSQHASMEDEIKIRQSSEPAHQQPLAPVYDSGSPLLQSVPQQINQYINNHQQNQYPQHQQNQYQQHQQNLYPQHQQNLYPQHQQNQCPQHQQQINNEPTKAGQSMDFGWLSTQARID